MNELDKSILGQRAHDIAVALLSDLMKDENDPTPLFVENERGGRKYNTQEIIDLYGTFYEDVLKGLQEYFGDEL